MRVPEVTSKPKEVGRIASGRANTESSDSDSTSSVVKETKEKHFLSNSSANNVGTFGDTLKISREIDTKDTKEIIDANHPGISVTI